MKCKLTQNQYGWLVRYEPKSGTIKRTQFPTFDAAMKTVPPNARLVINGQIPDTENLKRVNPKQRGMLKRFWNRMLG